MAGKCSRSSGLMTRGLEAARGQAATPQNTLQVPRSPCSLCGRSLQPSESALARTSL